VPNGSTSWFEPSTQRWAKQVMDIWLPTTTVYPGNTFIAGPLRGSGLGLLTALTGTLTGGTVVRALWTHRAQTTYNGNEMARTAHRRPPG
jgi:hypothetical protein